MAFDRMLQVAARSKLVILISALPTAATSQLPAQFSNRFPNTPAALIWCEELPLRNSGPLGDREPALNRIARELGGDDVADRLVGIMMELSLSAGEILVRQGDRSDDLFFIASGRSPSKPCCSTEACCASPRSDRER